MSGSPELGCAFAAEGGASHTGSRGCGQTNRLAAGQRVMHCKKRTGGTFQMNAQKMGRLALITATSGFMVGIALLNGGSSNAIGGLCNGRPASHTWLDASGQYGPALIDGTDNDDDIIGSDGDDTIDAGAGDDVVCGAAGDDSIAGGDGNDAIRGDTGDDDLDGGAGKDTVVGDGGNDTVAGGPDGVDYLVGGSGDDVMISADDHFRTEGSEGHEHDEIGQGNPNVVDKVN